MEIPELFAGVRIDKKRFSADIQRFKLNKTHETVAALAAAAANDDDDDDDAKPKSVSSKKRKQIESTVDVFKPLKKMNKKKDSKQTSEEKLRMKEIQKKTEEAAILRKKYRIHTAGHNIPPPLESFQQLASQYECENFLKQNLAKARFKEPTPIQRQAIPILLQGRELFACAPTGSGKTLAFMLPIFIGLKAPSRKGIRAIILCPTRELALQITREFRNFSAGKKFRIKLLTKIFVNTVDFKKSPCDILISTPSRLNTLIQSSRVDLASVEYLVLDESDKLFELGIVEEIDGVVNACSNTSIVRALFSATLPDSVEDLARTIMQDPIRVVVGDKNSASQTLKQRLVFVGNEEGKLLALRQIFKESLVPPILIFVETKERAKNLHRELVMDNVNVDSIHSDRSQSQREVAVERYREGKTWVLIATDLMARGMDFKGVNCVINYDIPKQVTTYIHRIGRSGRGGREGNAITLYTEGDVVYLRSIANVIKASGCDVPEWLMSLPKVKIKKKNVNK